MISFRGNRPADLRLPLGTVWMLENLAESKGRLEMLGKGRDARWRRKD